MRAALAAVFPILLCLSISGPGDCEFIQHFEVNIVPTIKLESVSTSKVISNTSDEDSLLPKNKPVMDRVEQIYSSIYQSAIEDGDFEDASEHEEYLHNSSYNWPPTLRRDSNSTNGTRAINDTDPNKYQRTSYALNYSTMFLILIPLLISIFLLCVGYCIRQRIWYHPFPCTTFPSFCARPSIHAISFTT